MEPPLRSAGRAGVRLADGSHRRRGGSAAVVVAGCVALAMGFGVLLSELAPMFAPRAETATVVAPISAPSPLVAGPSATSVSPATMPGLTPTSAAPPEGKPIDGSHFEMRIAVIGYQAMVRQGVSLAVLSTGPGHYPTTPWPGQPGNVGIAAHNTYWLALARLRVGDEVQIQTQHGLYFYTITGSRVVDPNDRTVLAPTPDNRLTLTSCYPLWAGALATQRLIFTARQIGGAT